MSSPGSRRRRSISPARYSCSSPDPGQRTGVPAGPVLPARAERDQGQLIRPVLEHAPVLLRHAHHPGDDPAGSG